MDYERIHEEAEMKAELDSWKCRAKELDMMVGKLELQLEEKCKEIVALNQKVASLEGQIEAYQYCMNCRR